MKYLNAAIKGVHHKNPVFLVDKQSRRQLKLSCVRASSSEVIEQISLAIEYLHHAPETIDDIQIAFRVDADPFRPVDASTGVAGLPNRVAKSSRAIQHLHPEIHGVDYDQVVAIQSQFGR